MYTPPLKYTLKNMLFFIKNHDNEIYKIYKNKQVGGMLIELQINCDIHFHVHVSLSNLSLIDNNFLKIHWFLIFDWFFKNLHQSEL